MALKILNKPPLTLQSSPACPEPTTSTAIYPNRQLERYAIEHTLGLPEFGNSDFEFKTKDGTLFANSYRRIVYGDHGPYIEFRTEDVKCKLQRHFKEAATKESYYEWLEPVSDSSIKVYYQLKSVAHLKNPPPGGFKGNRQEGYADYLPGFIYVSPDELNITKAYAQAMEIDM